MRGSFKVADDEADDEAAATPTPALIQDASKASTVLRGRLVCPGQLDAVRLHLSERLDRAVHRHREQHYD